MSENAADTFPDEKKYSIRIPALGVVEKQENDFFSLIATSVNTKSFRNFAITYIVLSRL